MTHVIYAYIIVTLLTAAVADTTTTTVGPTVPTDTLNITLTGYDDHYYAVSVTVGWPGWNFMLTFDPTISGIVVAHERFVGSNRTDRFDPGLSGSFQSVENLSDRMVGMDQFKTESYGSSSVSINVMLSHDPADTGFESFFSQPFDGLFYDDYTAEYAVAFAFRKTCTPGHTDVAGSYTYGGVDGRFCDELGAPTQPLSSCKVPLLNIEAVAFNHGDGKSGPFRALVLPVSDIVLPQALFDDFRASTKAKLVGEKYTVNCNATFDQLTVMIDNVTYPLEFPYLVDQFGDECVLRVRPSDGDGTKYCKKVCSGHFANLCPTMKVEGVLGLPFLHRYCVQYDRGVQTSRIGSQKNILKECDYGPRTTPRTSKGPPVAIIVAAAIVSTFLLVLVVGVAWYYYRRRNRRRMTKLVRALGSTAPQRTSTQWNSYSGSYSGKQTSKPSHDDFVISEGDLWIDHDRQIGCGAFARVFLAELRGPSCIVTGRTLDKGDGPAKVAVKQARSTTEQAREEMQRELDLMRDLGRHPHVVSLVGYVPLQTPLLVMEYCAKGDLLCYLRDQLQGHKEAVQTVVDPLQLASYSNTEISLKDLISFCWQISDGMTYLSSKGYIHRDLAARNILLAENMVAKIADFGLCRFTNEDLYVTYHGGKMPVRWLPPEALSTANFSTASDVWSYAVLLFEIFSAGQMPYAELQAQDILGYLLAGGRLEQPVLCPADVYDFMEECWQTQPDARPSFQRIRSFFSERLEYLSQGYGYLPIGSNNHVPESE